MLYVFVNSDKKQVFFATYDENSKNEFLKLHPKFIYHYTYFSEVTVYEEIDNDGESL